jgi:hypothetical protein
LPDAIADHAKRHLAPPLRASTSPPNQSSCDPINQDEQV